MAAAHHPQWAQCTGCTSPAVIPMSPDTWHPRSPWQQDNHPSCMCTSCLSLFWVNSLRIYIEKDGTYPGAPCCLEEGLCSGLLGAGPWCSWAQAFQRPSKWLSLPPQKSSCHRSAPAFSRTEIFMTRPCECVASYPPADLERVMLWIRSHLIS